ncbi:MAG TPA: methyltransferase domain-containing protein [Bryobacteraceae bacterium]|nr:methyltransferase domain-containing protein [Bryobacteraceae bacterium]
MRAFPIALLFASAAFPAVAQSFGAAENLAPYIPTPQIIVERMLEAGHVQPGDVVYDLGSGDGRIVITAAQKFGAKAVGVEIRPDLVKKAQERIKELRLDDRVSMVQGNALHVDLSGASVVTMYLLTSSNERLKPNLEKYLKPGARVVSNEFPIRGWKAVEVLLVKTGSMEHRIYVYEIGKTN